MHPLSVRGADSTSIVGFLWVFAAVLVEGGSARMVCARYGQLQLSKCVLTRNEFTSWALLLPADQLQM